MATRRAYRRNTKGGRGGTKSVGQRNRRSKAVHNRCDRAVERDTRRQGRAACEAGRREATNA